MRLMNTVRLTGVMLTANDGTLSATISLNLTESLAADS